jgi:hypothetical protein
MTALATLTTWKDAGDIVVAEGEGAGAYAELSRYRRTLIWSKGRYVLVLDDIRGAQENDITWLVQGPAAEAVDATAGRFRLRQADTAMDLQIVADQPLSGSVVDSPADDRGKPMGLRQIRAAARGRNLRLAAVFDVWGRGNLRVELTPAGDKAASVTVRGGAAAAGVWQWQAAPDADPPVPSTLTLRRADGSLCAVGPADQARLPGRPGAAR